MDKDYVRTYFGEHKKNEVHMQGLSAGTLQLGETSPVDFCFWTANTTC